jgi:Cu/Ag efflux protein CusF
MFARQYRTAFALALTLASVAPAYAGRPTVFDFMEYERRMREQSPTPHLHPWLAARIKSVSLSKRQIVFVHVPDASAGMPAMTMTLAVARNVSLSGIRAGGLVDVQIDSHGGKVWIIGLKQRR